LLKNLSADTTEDDNTEDDNSCYRNVCKMSVVSFALAVVFITSLSLLKNLSADATVAGIVKNILKIIQTFGNNSHKPHGQKGGEHCFKALPKYCKWLLSPVCFKIFRFLGMSVNPKLTFDSTLYQLAAHV